MTVKLEQDFALMNQGSGEEQVRSRSMKVWSRDDMK